MVKRDAYYYLDVKLVVKVFFLGGIDFYEIENEVF